MEYGESLGIMATGLGARDTLRLEAGMPLYGHELTEDIDPFQAGLGFACHLSGYNFPGRDALLKIEKQPPLLTRIGLEVLSPRVPRQECAIFCGRSADRYGHERHVLADAAKADRDGLRFAEPRHARHGDSNRHSRQPRACPRGAAAVL